MPANSDTTKQKVKTRAPKRSVAQQLADNRSTAQHKRKAIQEELRKKFKGDKLIEALENYAKELDELTSALAVAKTRRKTLTRNQQEQLHATRAQLDIIKLNIDAVKVKIDLNLRRLKFVIPELKSIEFDEGDGNPLERLALSMASITQSVSRVK